MQVAIIGAGVSGLTLALKLHSLGLRCTVYEATAEIRPLGVGLNVLPHASQVLAALGLEDELLSLAIETRELCFYNRFGQFIFQEPRGRFAGYSHPQYSIHRADLQGVLLRAVRERLGADSIVQGQKCVAVEQDGAEVILRFAAGGSGALLGAQRADIAVGCDGIHSAIRKQLYPSEGGPIYSGINMWRGAVVAPPFLTGASMAMIGWFTTGKMVVYPIRDNVDEHGNQLINWVAEVAAPQAEDWSWSREGRREDVLPYFEQMRFRWLDVAALIERTERILEYPMVDKDPLPRWSHGRVTLLGDAAHPMYPRGSNGAGQAILDASVLAECLHSHADPVAALTEYDARRREVTTNIVLTNRVNPPDAILREIHERTGDLPFDNVYDVISHAELAELSENYKRVAGFDRASLG